MENNLKEQLTELSELLSDGLGLIELADLLSQEIEMENSELNEKLSEIRQLLDEALEDATSLEDAVKE
tara:strand:+ start:435 stop:638 length:204 start_codon:yes stop_codon:yes gene_type:complete